MGGVYRHKLIKSNDLYFPEHLAYEDNYWVYALQLFLENIAVVPRKLYYYRQQNGSTSHKKMQNIIMIVSRLAEDFLNL